MELDNLRRRWQAQPAAPAADLAALLAERSTGPVAQMWRRVWTEAISGLVGYAVTVATVLYFGLPPVSLLLLAFTLIYGALGYSYGRKIQVLRRLRDNSGGLHQHVGRQLDSLRRLTRLHYWVAMGTAVVVLSVMAYWALVLAPGLGAAVLTPRRLLWLGATTVVSLVVTHFLVRHHLRTNYGQPIEQLARSLRELEQAGA